MLAVAALGLAGQHRRLLACSPGGDRDNLNLRAALLHVAGDLLGSAGAIVAALVILWTGWTPIDPILSVLVSLLILRSAWTVVRDSGHILLEASPEAFDAAAIGADLTDAVPEVAAVRHLHAWSITENRPMVTLEAVIRPRPTPTRPAGGSRPASPTPSASTTPPWRSASSPSRQTAAVAGAGLRVYLGALSPEARPSMPIKIPATLPAHDVLRREGVMVMSEETALRQDIRPLQIGLLNLMPKKVQTETQFARVIGATPLQIELTLIRMSDHEPRNTSAAHLEAFYQPFREARERHFDGLIITGAPIEHLDFEAVGYWSELREIFDWTQTHVHSTMGVCWGGMAMLHHFYGIPKHMLPAKAFGCFRHQRRSRPPRSCCRASPTASWCRSAAGPRCATRTSSSTPSSGC